MTAQSVNPPGSPVKCLWLLLLAYSKKIEMQENATQSAYDVMKLLLQCILYCPCIV